MLAAHESILLKQSVIRAILLKQFSSVCGGKVASNFAFLSESKISNVFDIFWHSCHLAHRLRRHQQFGSHVQAFCLRACGRKSHGLVTIIRRLI